MAPAGSSSSGRAWDALTPALSEWVLDAIAAMGFTRMTPVQASAIPLFMGHKDVVVEAVTGSGKTLAYLIPVVERLLRLEAPVRRHHVGAIILSPTRELAIQIHKVLQSLLAFHEPSAAYIQSVENEAANGEADPQNKFPSSTLKVVPQLLVGGSKTPAQDLSTFLKISPNLLISTPGRLLELLSSPHVHCPQSSFEVLVMDEADRLLDLGFKDDLQKLLTRLPKQRRTGLFSASVSEAVDQIIRVGLRNPVKIAVKVKGLSGAEDKRTPASLQMTYLLTPPSHKLPAVKRILSEITPTPPKTIIYFSTCAAVDYYQHILPSIFPSDISVVPLHGKHPPHVREKNFAKFTDAITPTVLLTTDVAARGLDIPSVDLVLQLDPPTDPKAFLHRAGRAGRAGRRGLSVIFLTPGREEAYVSFLDVRKTPITPLSTPQISTTDSDAAAATAEIRALVRADRALHDKAQRAFVSWVRSYSKHQAASIFAVASLDWADLGHAWGLLRLPSMPELKGFEGDRALGQAVDWSAYAYCDRQREKRRREKLELGRREAEERQQSGAGQQETDNKGLKRPASSVPWSQQLEKKDTKERKRERKRTKKDKERWGKLTVEEQNKELETQRMIEEIRNAKQAAKRKKNAIQEDEFEGLD